MAAYLTWWKNSSAKGITCLYAEFEYDYLQHTLSYSQKIKMSEIKGGQSSDFAHGKTYVYRF